MLLQYLPKGKIAPAADDDAEDDYYIPDFIFKIGALDVNSGLIHCGSRESYMVTLKMYLDAAARNADDIEKYWKVRDLKNTTIKVHALKSTSRVIGALKLGDFAAALEKAGESGDTDTLDKELGKLLEEYRALAGELEPLNEIGDEGAADDRPLISEQDMKEAYAALSEFCASFDYDSVVNIVESLESYRFPEEEITRFDAVKKAVDNFDYDMIPGILSGGEG